jgi:alpha-glucosidase
MEASTAVTVHPGARRRAYADAVDCHRRECGIHQRPALAVDRQQEDPQSQLNLTRGLIGLRQRSAALRSASLRLLDASAGLLAFERAAPGQTLLCVFNLGERTTRWQPAPSGSWRVIEQVGGADSWTLPAHSGLIAERA